MGLFYFPGVFVFSYRYYLFLNTTAKTLKQTLKRNLKVEKTLECVSKVESVVEGGRDNKKLRVKLGVFSKYIHKFDLTVYSIH